jgi:hypothetical protein
MAYAYVEVDLREVDTDDLIEQIESRGKFIVIPINEINDDLYKIRQAYLLESPDQFRKTIERLLSKAGIPV